MSGAITSGATREESASADSRADRRPRRWDPHRSSTRLSARKYYRIRHQLCCVEYTPRRAARCVSRENLSRAVIAVVSVSRTPAASPMSSRCFRTGRRYCGPTPVVALLTIVALARWYGVAPIGLWAATPTDLVESRSSAVSHGRTPDASQTAPLAANVDEGVAGDALWDRSAVGVRRLIGPSVALPLLRDHRPLPVVEDETKLPSRATGVAPPSNKRLRPTPLPRQPKRGASLSELKAFFEPDLSDRPFNATILIATPLRNARNHLGHFVSLLQALNYPHLLLSVAFGEDSSTDGTFDYALSLLPNLSDFRRVAIFPVHDFVSLGSDWASAHEERHQRSRRAHLAEARNKLLELALQDEQYVLWVDSDVGSWRPDVVQHLLDAVDGSGVDAVAPACMYWTADGRADVYDRNTWRETPASLAWQRRLPDDALMLEGYSDGGGERRRLYLTHLRSEMQRLVEVDGVGGCVLLVRAELHRRGVVFPPKPYKHHIETEGFAKLAKSSGYRLYGMPFLEVYHL